MREERVVREQRKIRVAVVFGGRGPEHPVSLLGGGHILNAIDRSKYEVIPVGITKEGRWLQVADEPGRLALADGELPTIEAVAVPGGQIVPWSGSASPAASGTTGPGTTGPGTTGPGTTGSAPAKDAGVVVATPAAEIPSLLGEVDVVFPVLHGPYGEDGTIQGLLEMAGVRYVGAGVLASAVSMDKAYMKLIFKAAGLPVGPYVVVRERDWPPADERAHSVTLADHKRVLDEIAELGWPLFVKPARGGSSIGTSRADDMGELDEAIALARQYDPKVLVEAAIDGVEIEVGVLEGIDGAPPDTSLPGQLVFTSAWDFEAKYLDEASGMTIPAPIPDSATAEVRGMAATAFEAVSCEGLARVDFFYTAAGKFIINEINTMPGLAPTSYWQRMWVASGKTLPELVDRILQTALAKRPGLR
jgi:D-alanine-D-alanine ligase